MNKRRPLRILITGASSGIGEALAYQFANDSHFLYLVARRKSRLEELSKKLHTPTTIIPLDVRDREKVKRELEPLDVDILINNAGLALGLSKFHEMSFEDIHQMIATNIEGLISCTHALLPSMVLRNQGHIVNLGSVAGTYPYPGSHVYGATKAFVEQFSLNLRADLLGTDIRVTCIAPGMTKTEFSQVRFKGNQGKAQEVYERTIPLLAVDIASLVHFCVALPPHININFLEVMSTYQAFGNFAIHRF